MKVQEDAIRYCFTKYLEISVKRCKKTYLQKKYRIENAESQIEVESIDNKDFDEENRLFYEKEKKLSWDMKELIPFLQESMSENVVEAQNKLREVELLVLYMRVLGQYSHREIAAMMHISEQQAASIYNYAKKKLRKELKKNGF